jgi:hypothetical protein
MAYGNLLMSPFRLPSAQSLRLASSGELGGSSMTWRYYVCKGTPAVSGFG